jgi:hypothetical protein
MEELSDALVGCGCDLAEVVAAKPNFFQAGSLRAARFESRQEPVAGTITTDKADPRRLKWTSSHRSLQVV